MCLLTINTGIFLCVKYMLGFKKDLNNNQPRTISNKESNKKNTDQRILCGTILQIRGKKNYQVVLAIKD